MEVWIIEDEIPAARRMAKIAAAADAAIEVTATYSTVAATVAALQQHQPDLLVMDIQLADGNSFHIFQQVEVRSPVIFTTAFDAFAIEAFKQNSIDYLLKPVKQEEFDAAIAKFKRIHAQPAAPNLDRLIKTLTSPAKSYKQRFVVRYGEHLKTIDTSAAAYFYTENKATFLTTHDNKRYIVDYHMDQLEELLDPKRFFRINRQFIIGIDAIAEMLTWSKARVLVKLNPPTKLETLVSSERAAAFKQWLDDALP